MNDPLFKILLLLVCLAVFWVYGAPPPSIAKLVETTARDKAEKPNRISTVSFGQEVNLDALAFPGKVTIIDFYSPGCPPCRQISPPLHAAVEKNPALALRVVDINRPQAQGIDWSSPVAQQHHMGSIPFFVVFDGTGTEVARGGPARTMVAELLNGR